MECLGYESTSGCPEGCKGTRAREPPTTCKLPQLARGAASSVADKADVSTRWRGASCAPNVMSFSGNSEAALKAQASIHPAIAATTASLYTTTTSTHKVSSDLWPDQVATQCTKLSCKHSRRHMAASCRRLSCTGLTGQGGKRPDHRPDGPPQANGLSAEICCPPCPKNTEQHLSTFLWRCPGRSWT